MSTEKVIDRIKKLLVKAQGTTNEAEAQVFFDKAHELMQKYSVEVSSDGTTQREVIRMTFPKKTVGVSVHLKTIACVLAKHMRVMIYTRGHRSVDLIVMGFQEDVEGYIVLLQGIYSSYLKCASNALKGSSNSRLNKNSYMLGYARGLDDSLKRNTELYALVTMKPQEVVDEYESINFDKSKPRSFLRVSGSHAQYQAQGYIDGAQNRVKAQLN